MNPFEQRLLDSPHIPTLPTVAQRILDLAQEEQPDLEALASVISCDPSLSAKVLSLINSAMYGLSREVVSLREAVIYLGINPVRSVTLSFALIAALRGDQGEPRGLDDLWRSSLMNALAARRLAAETGGWDPEEAFLAGLLADCGALLMFKMVPEYPHLVQRFCAGEGDLVDLERMQIETDHMRLGGLLLRSWCFPEPLCRLVECHHDPSSLETGSPEELRARVLNAAWLCSRALTVEGFASETAQLEQHVAVMLGLQPALVRAIASEIPDELRETARFFEIPTDRQRSFDEILEAANRALSSISLGAEVRAQHAEERASAFDDLLGAEHLPSLTSPAAFERMVEVVQRRARETRGSFGLMLIDLSELKAHQEPDGEALVEAVIQEVCMRAAHCLRSSDRAARIATDQVALLLPGCSDSPLRKAAGRVHAAIESEPIQTSQGPIECRAGIGLAASTPHRDGLDHRTLLSLTRSAADRSRTSPDRIVSGT